MVTILAATFALVNLSPAQALGSTTMNDASGVDYDPACLVPAPGPPPGSNSVTSPGFGPGCTMGLYDGSTETTDLRKVVLGSNTANQIETQIVIDGPMPSAGSTALWTGDLPSNQFEGATYLALFQNVAKHSNSDNLTTGCFDASSTRVPDIHGSRFDGYHFYVGYEVSYESGAWVHRVFVGEYDPSPGGGYNSVLLGTDTGAGWVDADPLMVNGINYVAGASGSTIVIRVDGVVRRTDPTCASPPGEFDLGLAEPGDPIVDTKAMSTADTSTLQPLVTAGQSFAGRTRGVSDLTLGSSSPGQFNTNISNIAYTPGTNVVPSDTLGPYTACVSAAPCHVDDEFFNLPRGSVYREFWDTPYTFVF